MNDSARNPGPALVFNPLSADFIRDPYPFYCQLREHDPMHRTPLGMYLASRKAEVTWVLRDKRFGKDYVGRTTKRYGPAIMEEPIFRSMHHWT
jgi:cytochrome P450